MTSLTAAPVEELAPETVDALDDLAQCLNIVNLFHRQCLEGDDSPKLRGTLVQIVKDRREICEVLDNLIELNKPTNVRDTQAVETDLMGTAQRFEAMRFGEHAARLEGSIVKKFRQALKRVSCYATTAKLLEYFQTVKRGRDQVLALCGEPLQE